MTTEFLNLDIDAFFEETVARGREQGVVDQPSYDDLVEQVIEQHRSLGEIHDDEPTEDMEEQLRGRWEEYLERVA
ncbi:hypothetical protein HZA85_03005 [Candidatus Uhrbacteria bacterium]|nr:hypothetical protein [Candidatus Uhrbacteria bacterium]